MGGKVKSFKLADTLRSFEEIINGGADSIPEHAFLYVGSLDEVREKAKWRFAMNPDAVLHCSNPLPTVDTWN